MEYDKTEGEGAGWGEVRCFLWVADEVGVLMGVGM